MACFAKSGGTSYSFVPLFATAHTLPSTLLPDQLQQRLISGLPSWLAGSSTGGTSRTPTLFAVSRTLGTLLCSGPSSRASSIMSISASAKDCRGTKWHRTGRGSLRGGHWASWCCCLCKGRRGLCLCRWHGKLCWSLPSCVAVPSRQWVQAFRQNAAGTGVPPSRCIVGIRLASTAAAAARLNVATAARGTDCKLVDGQRG